MKAIRPWHRLRSNHGNTLPQTLVFVDTETTRLVERVGQRKVERQRFMLGTACKVRLGDREGPRLEWFDFQDPVQFWGWLAKLHKPKRAVWLFACNLAFDLTALGFWDLLDEGYYVLGQEGEDDAPELTAGGRRKGDWEGLFCDQDPPTIIIARHGRHVLTCVDTFNYLPFGVGELGLWLGHPKLPMPGDAAELADWREYCGRDVQIIHDAMTRVMSWWKKEDLGVWRFTTPGLAMASFRHRFMKHPITIEPRGETTELARAALAAAEVKCAFVGAVTAPGVAHDGKLFLARHPAKRWREGPVYVVDSTSFYASVMKGNLYPTKLLAWKAPAGLDDLDVWQRTLCLVAEVKIETDTDTYPVWCEGRRWFARGRYTTTLCGPELRRAQAAGHVKDVVAIAAYAPGRIFDWFVDYWWAKRAEALAAGDKIIATWAKLILNSLAGKFGQLTPDWVDCPEQVPAVRWGGFARAVDGVPDGKKYRAIAGFTQELAEREETRDSFPAIEAFVNAYGRERMRDVRRLVGEDNVLYQHTDSLHLLPEGFRRLQEHGLLGADELGKFRLQRTVARAEYRGLNDYTHDGNHFVGGLKRSARSLGNGQFAQDVFPSLREIVASKPSGEIVIEERIVAIGRVHPQGVIQLDGAVAPPVVHGQQVIAPADWQGQEDWRARRTGKRAGQAAARK